MSKKIIHPSNVDITDFGEKSNEYIPAFYYPNFLSQMQMQGLLLHLEQVPFTKVVYDKYGKPRSTPRHTFCYGQLDNQSVARYRGADFNTEPIPDWLDKLRQQVEIKTKANYNAVILNKYLDGSEFINWHQDDEQFLAHERVASLSFGQPRDFQFKLTEDSIVHEICLQPGSLFIINDGLWHSLPKRARQNNIRYNITFRCLGTQKGVGNYYYYNRGNEYRIN